MILNQISRKLYALMAVVMLVIAVISCQKDFSPDGEGNNNLPDLGTTANASVSGFVTDENDDIVTGATVKFGSQTTTTDEYGYFEVRNAVLPKNAAMVSVTYAGYFKGIKTFIASSDNQAFFRIKLMPKDISGNIDAAAGGNISLTNGMKIVFPANAIMNASTNAPYTGNVNVAAQWIDPTSPELNKIMPGDLRGISSDGGMKALETYGMAAVELTGSGGELLQIKTGLKATLTMPLPSAIAGNAPSTIPLWHFDEAVGLWKEEGVAMKVGATYVGEVSHFSFWNCDVPANFVQFNCRLLDAEGDTVSNAMVKISLVSNPWNYGIGYTNSAGYVSGAIPANANLKMEVFGNNCGTAIYTQNFTTTNVNVSLGNITVATSASSATVTGTVTNCAGSPMTNGYVIMEKDNVYSRYAVSSTGTFSFTTLFCNNATASISLIAEDATAGQQGSPLPFSITPGANNIGNLQACGISTSQFFNFTVNGTPYSYTTPPDSIMHSGQGGTTLFANIAATTNNGNNYTSLGTTATTITVGSTIGLTYFYTSYITDSTSIVTPIQINVTEYGAVGEYFAGNFTGTLRGAAPANTNYNITANFRVRRRF